MSTDADAARATTESDADEQFRTPPRTVADDAGRDIELRPAGESVDERESLAAMYDDFGTADRAQGIPPASARRRQQWLDRLETGLGVVAWHDERAVGHGILLGDGSDHELALFVRPDYRGAGVGSALLRTLLGHGRSSGVDRVWLSVQRTNRPALHLYRKVGFRPTEAADSGTAMALEMVRSLR